MYIGIDIGGTSLKIGLVNDKAEIIEKIETATKVNRGYDRIRDDLILRIKDLKAQAQKLEETIEYIGIGIPGVADDKGKHVVICPNLYWENVPLGNEIENYFNIPVYIDNDATVASIAENIRGSTKGYNTSIFITIGTGIGGGFIINNKVYSGMHGVGSEIGHMIVGENFYNCNCGNNGCLETFASSTAMIKYTRKLIEEGDGNTVLLDKTKGRLDPLNTKLIFEAAKAGDKVANQSVNRMIKYLAIGIANLMNILDPDIVSIGGGVSKAGDFLLQRVKGEVSKYLLNKDIDYGEILLAELGNDAGLIGAGMLGRR